MPTDYGPSYIGDFSIYVTSQMNHSIDLSNHLKSFANWLMLAGIPFISEAGISKINF